MSNTAEKRQFHRYSIFSFPILIDAPSLSDIMLDPEDFSLGGFRVVVSEEPTIGDLVDCSVELKGKEYQGCNVRIAWTSENETDPPTWSVGLSFSTPQTQPSDFYLAMEDATCELSG